MDLHMPTVNGVEATRRLAVEAPGVSVLVLTMFDDDESVLAAMRAGARGYLVKGAAGERILGAVRAVAAGEGGFRAGGPPPALRVPFPGWGGGGAPRPLPRPAPPGGARPPPDAP